MNSAVKKENKQLSGGMSEMLIYKERFQFVAKSAKRLLFQWVFRRRFAVRESASYSELFHFSKHDIPLKMPSIPPNLNCHSRLWC